MGMRGKLEQIPPALLDRFIENPRLAYNHIVSAQTGKGARNRKKLQIVKGLTEPRKEFSLEKDWQLVHYVLNRTVAGGKGPLADVVLGGDEIPDLDGKADYGPLRYLSPVRVKAVASALAEVNMEELAAAFDPEDAASKGIYGLPLSISAPMVSLMLQHLPPEKAEELRNHLSNKPIDLSSDDVAALIDPVRTFYLEAARDGKAMLLYII
jgi:hypothetical protein